MPDQPEVQAEPKPVKPAKPLAKLLNHRPQHRSGSRGGTCCGR
jgi:hypothetical protein